MNKIGKGLKYYPIALNLNNKTALLIGGGAVAERKANSLLGAGARIRLISPAVTVSLAELADLGRIRWLRRNVKQTDLRGVYIVITATSNRDINRKVSNWAKEALIPVNVVDDSSLCDFISPAVFENNKAIVTVYTDGRDPVLSRDLKNFLKEKWDEFLSYRNRL